MSDDFFDLNDAEPQRDFQSPAPPGNYQLCPTVKSGRVADNALRMAKNGRTWHLELEHRIVGGEDGAYNGNILYDYITLKVDETDYGNDPDILPLSYEQAEKYRTAVRMGRSKLKAMIDSAFGLDPNDMSDEAKAKRLAVSHDLLTVSGLKFWARVEIEQGRNGYKDKNTVDFIITPDLPDYPRPKLPRSKDLNDEIPY